jgi:hypothetical protein
LLDLLFLGQFLNCVSAGLYARGSAALVPGNAALELTAVFEFCFKQPIHSSLGNIKILSILLFV